MEKLLYQHFEEIMTNPGVTGVLCADQQGLCLGAKGSANGSSSGMLVSLRQIANQLPHAEDTTGPVICLESDNLNILVKRNEDITTAIYKSPA